MQQEQKKYDSLILGLEQLRTENARLKEMLEYNAYLLNEIEEGDNKEMNATDKIDELLELLKNMSEEERAALMAEASK
ncbi:MAG: hypothetical protein ACI38V_07845 [Bacteroides sp.]